MPKIRVVVAEDSLTMRRHLVSVLQSDPDVEVVGEACDGRTAIELCVKHKPDLLTCDLVMPNMSGVAVTEYLMSFSPLPILICSSSFNRGEVFRTFDALAAGAVDVIEKPSSETGDWWSDHFRISVKQVAAVGTAHSTALRDIGDQIRQQVEAVEKRERSRAKDDQPRLIAIGAGTGGPAAVRQILLGLPHDLGIPIVLTIHANLPFGATLAEWLDGQSPISVSFAEDGAPLPERGETRVLYAPPSVHLVVEGERTHFSTAPARHGRCPSIDVLFESIARDVGPAAVGCLLTGMGEDGAAGLAAIKRAGGRTIAQSPETCVIGDIPAAAIRARSADEVQDLDDIAAALVRARVEAMLR